MAQFSIENILSAAMNMPHLPLGDMAATAAQTTSASANNCKLTFARPSMSSMMPAHFPTLPFPAYSPYLGPIPNFFPPNLAFHFNQQQQQKQTETAERVDKSLLHNGTPASSSKNNAVQVANDAPDDRKRTTSNHQPESAAVNNTNGSTGPTESALAPLGTDQIQAALIGQQFPAHIFGGLFHLHSPGSFFQNGASNILGSSSSVPYISHLNGSAKRKRRIRTIFTEEQLKILEQAFGRTQYPDVAFRDGLAAQCNLKEERVEVWFKNRRAKERKKSKDTSGVLIKSKTSAGSGNSAALNATEDDSLSDSNETAYSVSPSPTRQNRPIAAVKRKLGINGDREQISKPLAKQVKRESAVSLVVSDSTPTSTTSNDASSPNKHPTMGGENKFYQQQNREGLLAPLSQNDAPHQQPDILLRQNHQTSLESFLNANFALEHNKEEQNGPTFIVPKYADQLASLIGASRTIPLPFNTAAEILLHNAVQALRTSGVNNHYRS